MQKPEQSARQVKAAYNKAYRAANPDSYKTPANAAAKARYAASPRGMLMKRTNQQAKRYGLTREQAAKLLAVPCKICDGVSEHIDHCHITGKVRAALCGPCNKGLGFFNDNADRLAKAADYIKDHE